MNNIERLNNMIKENYRRRIGNRSMNCRNCKHCIINFDEIIDNSVCGLYDFTKDKDENYQCKFEWRDEDLLKAEVCNDLAHSEEFRLLLSEVIQNYLKSITDEELLEMIPSIMTLILREM